MVYALRNGRRVVALLSFLLLCCGVHVHAQRVAVKTNTLGWLTASPNVEAEFVLGRHISLNMGVAANPISTDNFKTTFTHFQPEVRYLELQHLVKHEFIDPGIYQVFLQTYRENPWRVRDWYWEQLEQFCAQKDVIPEGAQFISLTKTFASQILKDYPESLKNAGLETVEHYMEYLSGSRHIQELKKRFYQLLQGMEQCLEKQKGYSRVVSDIRTYCSQHLSDSALGGQMISDHFGLSATYLNQLFKQELGMTIKQYISEMRMERAEQLLTQTYETVDEIATKCGYSNGNYFAKAFRENRKMPPTDYRKMMGKRYETKGTT